MLKSRSRAPVPIGTKFNRLTVLREIAPTRHKDGSLCRLVVCRCDCGVTRHFRLASIKKQTKSCGCLQIERTRILVSSRNTTHGCTKGKQTSEYRAWCGIKERCFNPNIKNYEDYGGRGIDVCDEWVNDFAKFLSDMGPRPSPKHSINRIDNDGDYTPNNCNWATPKEQSRNRRSNKIVNFEGEEMPLVVACERAGLKYTSVYKRLYHGRPVEGITLAREAIGLMGK